MHLTQTYIKGLSNYKVNSVNIRPALLSAVFVIQFDKIEFEGFHNSTAYILGYGLENGQGPYRMALNNVVMSVTLQFDWINFQYIELHQFKINFVMGIADVNFQGFNPSIGTLFNNIASVAIPSYLILKQGDLNQRIHEELIPVINEYILTDVAFSEIFQFLIRFFKDFGIKTLINYIQDLVCHL